MSHVENNSVMSFTLKVTSRFSENLALSPRLGDENDQHYFKIKF